MVTRIKTTEVTAKAVAVPTGRRKSVSFSSTPATLILKPPFQLGERSEHDAPYHRQCVGTASVERVLRGMVVAAQEGSKVDDVHGRYAGRGKRQVIVLDRECSSVWKSIPVTEPFRAREDQLPEPRRRVGLRPELRIASADHIEQHHGPKVGQFSKATECFNETSTPVKAVGRGPVLDGLFAVEENKPIGQPMRLFGQNSREFNELGCTRSTVVRAHKHDPFQPRRVVVAGDNHHIRPSARQGAHDVRHGNGTIRRARNERLTLYLSARGRELRANVLPGPLNSGRPWQAGAERDEPFHIFEGSPSVKTLRRLSEVSPHATAC